MKIVKYVIFSFPQWGYIKRKKAIPKIAMGVINTLNQSSPNRPSGYIDGSSISDSIGRYAPQSDNRTILFAQL